MPTPLPDLWDAYHESRSPERLAKHTWTRLDAEFDAIGRLLTREVGELPTSEHLTQKNLRAAFATYSNELVVRKKNGVLEQRSKSTIAGCMSTWSVFLTFLVSADVIPGNPMAAMKKPKVPKGTPKALTGDAAERLIESLRRGDRAENSRHPWPQRDLAFMAFYITTGVRSSEGADLSLGDMDIREGESRAHIVGKGSKERWQPVPESTVMAIAEYMESRQQRFPPKGKGYAHDAPLFVGDFGEKLNRNKVRYIVEQCYEAAGIRSAVPAGALTHALRHLYGTRLAKDKVQATIIKELLGHGSLNTSQIYIGVDQDDVREAAQGSSLAALFADRDTARHTEVQHAPT